MTTLDAFTLDDIAEIDPTRLELHGDRYLVEMIEVDNKRRIEGTDGRVRTLHVPGGTAMDDTGWYLARIITGGDGHRMEANVVVPMPYTHGQVVIVEKYSGKELRIHMKTYRIINQVDVLARVPDLEDEAQEARALAAV